MIRRVAVLITIATLAAGFLASAALASGSTNSIISDASDGVINGSYTASQVRAALHVVRTDPVYSQYSDIEGVLTDYLAGLRGNGQTGGSAGNAPTSSQQATGSSSSQSHQGNRNSSGKQTAAGATSSIRKGDVLAAGAFPAPPASVDLEHAGSRLSAMPWFFWAMAAAAVIGFVAMLRRHGSTD